MYSSSVIVFMFFLYGCCEETPCLAFICLLVLIYASSFLAMLPLEDGVD